MAIVICLSENNIEADHISFALCRTILLVCLLVHKKVKLLMLSQIFKGWKMLHKSTVYPSAKHPSMLSLQINGSIYRMPFKSHV